MLAALFNNLVGIISRPVAFFSSIFLNRLKRTSRLGAFRQNNLSVHESRVKTRDLLLKQERLGLLTCPIFVKCSLKASAMSPEVLIVLLST